MLTKDEQFFYDHAGFCYDPKTQTAEQGQTECAQRLAAAELAFMRSDARCEWADDSDSAAEMRHEGEPFDTCEYCVIRTADGTHLASLHAITDASPNYRRVVRAQLAFECIDQL